MIRIIKSQGGRFLKQIAVSSSSGQLPTFWWVQSPDSLVRSKVKQALRDTGRQAGLKASPRRSVNYAPTSSQLKSASAKGKRNSKNFGPTVSLLHRNDSVQQDNSSVTLKSASSTLRQNTGLGSSIPGDNSAQRLTPWSPRAGVAAAVGISAGVPIPAWTSSDQLGNVIHESSQRIKSLVMGSASSSSLNQAGLSPGVVESCVRVAGVSTAVSMTTREVLQRYAMQELHRGPGDPSHLSASEIFELEEELQKIVTRSNGNQASKPLQFQSN